MQDLTTDALRRLLNDEIAARARTNSMRPVVDAVGGV
jgi:hypothetical protein